MHSSRLLACFFGFAIWPEPLTWWAHSCQAPTSPRSIAATLHQKLRHEVIRQSTQTSPSTIHIPIACIRIQQFLSLNPQFSKQRAAGRSGSTGTKWCSVVQHQAFLVSSNSARPSASSGVIAFLPDTNIWLITGVTFLEWHRSLSLPPSGCNLRPPGQLCIGVSHRPLPVYRHSQSKSPGPVA
jgi:hypothetical protein